MPELIHRLYGEDPGFWTIVAECWGVTLPAVERKQLLPTLRSALLNRPLFDEIIRSLPQDAQDALTQLKRHQGVMPWAVFSRQFGEVRSMGASKRDRSQPQRQPVSPVEVLWYRALIGKDYLSFDDAILECAYIPAEFLDWLPEPASPTPAAPGEKFPVDADTRIQLADDHILDQTCTLLASLRLSQPDAIPDHSAWNPPLHESLVLMQALKLIDARQLPDADTAKPFLSASRSEALLQLAQGWLHSPAFNELFLVPTLEVDSQVKNKPVDARQQIIKMLERVPGNQWWSIEGLIRAVYQQAPDFLRPDGNYDQWRIRSAQTGEPLQGFAQWYAVEGALIRYLLSGPLHWLGFVDLALTPPVFSPSGFRLSGWFAALIAGNPPDFGPQSDDPIKLTSAGSIRMTTATPRYGRYMIARFCRWESSSTPGTYAYRLTPKSLQTARDQGLKVTHLLTLLRRYSLNKVPPSLVKALKHWDATGPEVAVAEVCILRVSRAEIMAELRQSSAARFLAEPLNPLSVIVPRKALDKVLAVLASMGYLADVSE